MLAYADPRAYTDRLNAVFGPAGWTRDYRVQVVQNFERKERGATERTITAKIVVTCKLTIHGFGAHTGLGEEWADNENAGTAAEAQAFKRACSCFGLGRYLYDLEGQWMDLDEHKRPCRRRDCPTGRCRMGTMRGHSARSTPPMGSRSRGRTARPKRQGWPVPAGGARPSEEVVRDCRLQLSKSVLRTVANTEDPDKIRDMAKLTDVFARLQDLARGVERLRAAAAKVGDARYSALCRELNLASESVDDIPDRRMLRRLVEALERGGGSTQTSNGTRNGAAGNGIQSGAASLGDVRGRLLHEANRSQRYKTAACGRDQPGGEGNLQLCQLENSRLRGHGQGAGRTRGTPTDGGCRMMPPSS